MWFSYRRCQQTDLQTLSHARRSAKGEPSGGQGPVSSHRVFSTAARSHPHPAPQSGETPAVPPGAPPPLPAEAAAGLRHLRYSPGEAALQRFLWVERMTLLPPLLSNICCSLACLAHFCSLGDAVVLAAIAAGAQLLIAKLGRINKGCLSQRNRH